MKFAVGISLGRRLVSAQFANRCHDFPSQGFSALTFSALNSSEGISIVRCALYFNENTND
jgi:hypothetical protein